MMVNLLYLNIYIYIYFSTSRLLDFMGQNKFKDNNIYTHIKQNKPKNGGTDTKLI